MSWEAVDTLSTWEEMQTIAVWIVKHQLPASYSVRQALTFL